MAGNVWEWVSSLWGTQYDVSHYGNPYDPNDGRENMDEPASVIRVLRGGGWEQNIEGVRCACRGMCDPSHPADIGGFRVASSGG